MDNSSGSIPHDTEDSTTKSDAQAMESAMKSLPLYVLDEGQQKIDVPSDTSYMIAVQNSDRRDPAIVMTPELVNAILASTRAGLELIYQKTLAKQKKAVVLEFQQWIGGERNRVLTEQLKIDESLKKLDDDQELTEQQIFEIDDQVSEATKESYKANLDLLGLLQETFENNALVDDQNERFEALKPDDEFLSRWKIPEPERPSDDGGNTASEPGDRKPRTPSPPPGRSRSSHQSSDTNGSRGRAPERPRSRSSSPRRDDPRAQSPTRRRYRSRSPPRDRSGSLTPRANRTPSKSANSQQGPAKRSPQRSDFPQYGTHTRTRTGRGATESPYEPVPETEQARRDFYAFAEDLRKAHVDFDKRHEITKFPSDPWDKIESRHPFEIFKELNRIQVEAEEKFRQARRRCNWLGVDVFYDTQSSCFPPDNGAEKEQRALFARFVGPEKYPQVQTWLDGVPNDQANAALPDHQPSDQVETDEWEPRPWLDYDDCWSAVAVGVGKGRIKRAEAMRENRRQEAKDKWAKSLNISKDDWDARHRD